MTLNINIETKNVIKIFTIAVLFTVGVFALTRMYDALVLVITAFFFALALNPAVSFVSRFMPKKKRGLAVALVMIIGVALVSFVAFSIISPVAREASAFADIVPDRLAAIRRGDTFIGEKIQQYNLQDDIDNALKNTQDNIESFAKTGVSRVGDLGNSFITILTGFVMTVLMLLNGPVLLRKMADKIYRDKTLRERHEGIADKMYKVVTGYVNGQVLIALIASLFALGALFLLRIPYPLPLASIVFIFGLIPLIGNTLAAILVVLFSFVLKDVTSALILGAFFVLYQQIENATLQPLIQGKTTQLPTLVIFVSVVLGVALMGPIGGLFAIPAAGCVKVLLGDYLQHRDDLEVGDTPLKLATKLKNKLTEKVAAKIQ
ncbi:MAG: AI-2E family transporter [Candidatus Saccharimonadales bacterium]